MGEKQKAVPRSFLTTNGTEVPLRAVPQVLVSAAERQVARRMREAGEPVDPPTYTVVTVAGTEETHDHDGTTLVVAPDMTGLGDPQEAASEAERRTEENRRAWQAHVEAKAKLEQEQRKAASRVMLEEGISLPLPEDGAWQARQRRYGVEIPEDPDDLRYHWLTTEVLVTPADLMNAIQGISGLTYEGAVKPEDIDAMMSTFRRRMERVADRFVAEGAGEALAVQLDPGGGPDGQGLGQDAGRVPQPAIPGPGGNDGGREDMQADGGGRGA